MDVICSGLIKKIQRTHMVSVSTEYRCSFASVDGFNLQFIHSVADENKNGLF